MAGDVEDLESESGDEDADAPGTHLSQAHRLSHAQMGAGGPEKWNPTLGNPCMPGGKEG